MTTFTDNTKSPVVVPPGASVTPFSSITASDPVSTTENLSVTLGLSNYYYGQTDLGTLSDPLSGGSFNAATHTFTESGLVTGVPTSASQILSRLVYTPPKLSNGSGFDVNATVSVNGSVDPTSPQLDVVTPPSVTGTTANEPVASGSTIQPFGTIQIADLNFNYGAKVNATITVTDGAAPTDADGLLTGTGLSKTGPGTYSIVETQPYTVAGYLRGLVFTPAAVQAGGTRTTSFGLDVIDAQAGLDTKDATTSVLTVGPPLPPMPPAPPLIAGVSSNETVLAGNLIEPFHGVTVSDTNTNPLDSATITLTGGGTLSGAGLVADATSGKYDIAASSPAALSADLDQVIFTPPSLNGQSSAAAGLTLAVTDQGQTASASTTVTETAQPPAPPNPTFIVVDQTTGGQSYTSGDVYTGPYTGLQEQLVVAISDNVNLVAKTPNVFLKSGSGEDALQVLGGSNVMDGGTGSNFLVGATGSDGGVDTFFTDARSSEAVWNTLVNFHSGDSATLWGFDPGVSSWHWDGISGAAGYTGATLRADVHGTGATDASITFTGLSMAQAQGLQVTTGTVGGIPYLYVHNPGV